MTDFVDIAVSIIDDSMQLSLENGDLKGDRGLETAVLLSLYTDQRVAESEIPAGQTRRRGYWGDLFPDVDGDKMGSKLWTLDRAKATIETVAAMETRAAEALSWMKSDGVASAVSVVGTLNEYKQAVFDIVITRPTGEENRFNLIWDEQELKRA